ncbi:MAG: carboxypeptidase regulatory-like domain-containing protein [Planctomycetes bacterium]|nr:carboxypeptidase regulatory-like domain-containing protein [Planctomycetota bacterium]
MRYNNTIPMIFVYLVASFFLCKGAFAGVSYTLSRNADYSTDDRSFLATDTLYVKISQNKYDYHDVTKAVFTLKPKGKKENKQFELAWNTDQGGFTGSTALDEYDADDVITIKIILEWEDYKIRKKDTIAVGISGKWEIAGTVYDEASGDIKDARVRIQGVADINDNDESYYPEEEGKYVLTDEDGNFSIEYEGISGQEVVVAAGKEGYKNGGEKITLGKDDNVSIALSMVTEEDHTDYEYRSAKNCKKCHENIYNDWNDSEMATAAVNSINQLVFLLYTAWFVTGDRANFQDASIFNNPNPEFVGDKGKIFEDATGRYKILGDAGNLHDCADCHSPSFASGVQSDGKTPKWDMRAGVLTDADNLSSIDKQGVHCDFCHKIQNVHDGEEYWTEPGVNYKVDLLRPDPALKSSKEGKVMFGPFDDVTYKSMQASYVSQFKKSEICTPCHQDARKLYLQPVDENDQPTGEETIERILWSEDTYREWRFSGYSGLEEDYPVDNYAGQALQCQDCHMKDPPPDPATGKSIADYTEVTDSFYMLSESKKQKGTSRDPRTIYPHHFEGTNQNLPVGEKKRYLDWAVDLSISNANVADGIVSFDVNVKNSHTGHAYPSGVTQRNVVLFVEAEQSGNSLTQINDQIIDTPGGNFPDGYYEGEGDYAGKPGKIFIKHNRMIEDNEDLDPFFNDILYAFAVEELYDTRIQANETDTTHYEFQTQDNSAITITARLIYRFYPKGTLEFAAQNGYVISLEENDYESHKVSVSIEP